MKKIKKFFFGTYIRGFVVSYFLFLMGGAILLKLPISVQDGQSLAWIDAIFVSVSGMSTTGLSTIVVRDVLTQFGQTVLAFILQFGGIGLIMFISTFWLITRRKIGFRERNMIMTDQNQIGRAGIVGFIKNVLIMIFSIEIIGFVIMVIILNVNHSDVFTFSQSLFQSFFLTISMFTNAGFDISPNIGDPSVVSLIMYKNDYAMQTLGMTLMVLGAIGFWPLAELKLWIEAKWKKEKFEFSMFSKLLISMHLGIWIVSAIIVYGVEFNGFLADKGFIEGVYYSLFMSLTTRNAGFATMSMTDMSTTTQVLFGVLMFIGSSPNSAGGGIRTTTFLITVLGFISYARGKNQVVIKRKSIKPETIYKSLLVLIGAVALIVTGLLIMTFSEQGQWFGAKEIFFELASAFGTTGLSLGITSDLTIVGKLVLILTMFIGRVGVLALLLMFKGDKKASSIQYPEVDMIVG
jgi:Trk-type K+ transport system membrane component